MKLGSNDIGSVYIGSTEVNKIYIGSTEVWSSFTGLLDTYTGAAAAYSLRQLKSGVTNAIRVRRASDNAESDIGFVSGQLDTSTLETFCSGTNGFVTTWYDQSGNTNDATQSTSANQPQIVSGGSTILENGKPSLSFDGSSEIFSNSSHNNNLSIFVVAKSTNSTTAQTIVSIQQSPITSFTMGLSYNRDANNSIGSRAFDGSTYGKQGEDITITDLKIFTQITDTTTNSLYIDTTQGTKSYNAYLNSLNNFINIGCRDSGITRLIGYISELITYNSDQSSNRTGIETNINSHYNIY